MILFSMFLIEKPLIEQIKHYRGSKTLIIVIFLIGLIDHTNNPTYEMDF